MRLLSPRASSRIAALILASFSSAALAQGAPAAPSATPATASAAPSATAPATAVTTPATATPATATTPATAATAPATKPPPPPTPEQIAKAKTLFDLGAKAYDSEQFPAAIQAFQEAYRLSQRPGPIFSIAQAYRRLYNTDRSPETLRQAVAHYRQYVEKQKTGGRVAEAQQAIRDLEPVLVQIASMPVGVAAPPPSVVDAKPKTRLMVSSPTKGALVSLDGGDAAEMPFIQELTPGPHTLRLAADGYIDDEREILAADGQVYGLDIALKERPALLTIKTDPGAQIAIDGRNEGVAPLVRPIELSSGVHLVTITRVGYRPYSAETELKRDEKRSLDVPLERTTQRFSALGVLGSAGASAVIAAVLGGLAYHEQDIAKDIEAKAALRSISEAERLRHEEAASLRDDLRLAAFSSLGAAGLLTLIGAGMFFFDRPQPGLPMKLHDGTKKPEAKRPTKIEASLTPFIAPTAIGATVQGSF